MGGGHVSRPDFGMAQPDPAHPLTEFYQLVQQALDKAGCFALPALYASLQAPARRIYPEEAREYLRLAPQAGEGFVRLDDATQQYLNECWDRLKIQDEESSLVLPIVCGVIAVAIIGVVVFVVIRKKKKEKYYQD